MEDTGFVLTGSRRLSTGSGCACDYTAICALGHLNYSMVLEPFWGREGALSRRPA